MSKNKEVSKSELKKMFSSAYETKDEVSNFQPDEGKYPTRYNGAKLEKSQSSGRWQIHYVIVFMNGEYKGKKLHSFDGVDNEQSMRFAIKRLEAMGFDVEEFDELEDTLKKIEKKKPAVWTKVKQSGDYTNTFALGLMTEEEVEEAEEGGESDDKKEEKEEKEDKKKEDVSFEKGDKVKFENKEGDDVEGVIKSIDGDDVIVKDDDGEKHEVDIEDLEKVEDDDDDKDKKDKREEDITIEKGMKVECFKKGKSLGIGKVRALNESEGTVTVKIDGEKKDFKVEDLKLAE